MKSEGVEPVLPPNDLPHITDWLFAIGPTAQDGPIGWQDILAWSSISGVDLTPWEATTVRRLSKALVNQRHDAKKPTCPEPRLQGDEVAIRDKVGSQFAAMIAAFKAG